MKMRFSIHLAPFFLLELTTFSCIHCLNCGKYCGNPFNKCRSLSLGIEQLSHTWHNCGFSTHATENRDREAGYLLSPRSKVGIYLLRVKGGFDVWADTPDGDESLLQSSRSAKAVRKAARQCPKCLPFCFQGFFAGETTLLFEKARI